MAGDVIAAALADLRARSPQYQHYTDYYFGNHRLTFATDKFRNAFGDMFAAFADNLCAAPVDAVADRLEVEGFEAIDGKDEVAQLAWNLWNLSRMDRHAGETHMEALRTGDAYVIIWPDADGNPIIHPNRAGQVTVQYDEERPDLILWAVKVWITNDDHARVNVYFPDRTEKYVTTNEVKGTLPEKDTELRPYEVEGEPWPLPNPYDTVPVFHFGNNAGIGEFGHSELINVIPLQDALNKSIADMLVAMEFVALPQRWITGVEVPTDHTTGKPMEIFTPGADRVWAIGAEDARFGQFDPANLSQFITVQEMFRTEIARISGIPLHYLMLMQGNFPSGEALRTAEGRFVSKVRDRQVAYGNVWEDVMQLAVKMHSGADVELSTKWRNASPRSERELVEIGRHKQVLDVSKKQIWRELGYTEDQIEKMDEDNDRSGDEVGSEILRMFDRGRLD
jgi:hypothetical protein